MTKIVLTGGPCSGKTTIAKRLRDLGFTVVPEAAEMVIRSGKKFDTQLDFQWEIFRLQQRLEAEYEAKSKILFLDRGTPDGVAYTKYWGFEPPKQFIEASKDRYDRVLFFERLPFKNEGFRVEMSEKDAERAERLLLETYEGLGYKLDLIPIASIEERLKIVLRKVGLYPRI